MFQLRSCIWAEEVAGITVNQASVILCISSTFDIVRGVEVSENVGENLKRHSLYMGLHVEEY